MTPTGPTAGGVPGPLSGVVVARPAGPPSVELEVAGRLLGTLGARVVDAGQAADVALAEAAGPPPRAGQEPSPRAVLVRDGLPPDPAGVPDGTMPYAVGLTWAAGALSSLLGGAPIEVRAVDVAAQLFLPQVMAAAYGSPTWPAPPAPVPCPGGGWLSCELGAPGDRERYDLLLSTVPAGTPAAEVARAAQEWRLPVCDYRPRAEAGLPGQDPVRVGRTGGPGGSGGPPADRKRTGAPLDGVTVCDLTAMWAGPLCTWLLARLGATVWKVEPPVRPDGMRAFDGRGIHPDGRTTAPGNDSGLFHALNSAKQRVGWDLRRPGDRERLAELVGRADLVVDSFSPRVMPNLGLTRNDLARWNDRVLTISLPAFPAGPMRAWVAYGTGIHAVSGLGTMPDGSYASPAVTYPDPLAGLTAAVAALAGLVGRDRGWAPAHLEVALQSAVMPLLHLGRPSPRLADRDAGIGPKLLEAAGADAMAGLEVAGRVLPHPVGPFRAKGIRAPGAAAPTWPGCAS